MAQLVSAAQAHLGALCEQHGVVTPAAVVADAVNPDSPLHSMFEWDDTEAARKFRLVQAGILIRRYKIEVDVRPDRILKTRAFSSVPLEDGTRGYVPTDRAMADPERRDFVVQQATRELAQFRRKYQDLIDVDQLLNAAARASEAVA